MAVLNLIDSVEDDSFVIEVCNSSIILKSEIIFSFCFFISLIVIGVISIRYFIFFRITSRC